MFHPNAEKHCTSVLIIKIGHKILLYTALYCGMAVCAVEVRTVIASNVFFLIYCSKEKTI